VGSTQTRGSVLRTSGSGPSSPTPIAQTVAVFVGAAALRIGAFLYAPHHTTVLRAYLIFLASIFLSVLSFWFREIGDGFAALSAGSGTIDSKSERTGAEGASVLFETVHQVPNITGRAAVLTEFHDSGMTQKVFRESRGVPAVSPKLPKFQHAKTPRQN